MAGSVPWRLGPHIFGLVGALVVVAPVEAAPPAVDPSRAALAWGRCVVKSVEAGGPPGARAPACIRAGLERLQAQLLGAGPGSASKRRAAVAALQSCAEPGEVSKIRLLPPPPGESEDGADLPEPFLRRLSGVIEARGQRLMHCYSRLATGPVPPQALRAGRVEVELRFDGEGRVDEVVLVDNDGVHPKVVGCVVAAMCGVAPGPPPGGAAFSIAVPFQFKDPR